jgi:hypothetical protein
MLGLGITATWIDALEGRMKWLPRIRSVRVERVTDGPFMGCYSIYLRVLFSGGYCEKRVDIWADDELGAVTEFIKTYSCHVTFGVGDEQSID